MVSNLKVSYASLLADGEAGAPSVIFDLLAKQDDKSKAAYIQQIALQLEGIDQVSPAEAKIAFMSIDPGINVEIINQYITVRSSYPRLEYLLLGAALFYLSFL